MGSDGPKVMWNSLVNISIFFLFILSINISKKCKIIKYYFTAIFQQLFLDGGRISIGDTSDPSLTITDARETDEGIYECLLRNGAGEAESGGKHLDVWCESNTIHSNGFDDI